MNDDTHAKNRAWALSALDELQAFLDDADFEGDIDAETTAVGTARERLREARYGVVFLGAFNVGKSSLINALLGEAYLPAVFEECTDKITHVVRAGQIKTVLKLSSAAPPEETDALRDAIGGLGTHAAVLDGEAPNELTIAYDGNTSAELVESLKPLVTRDADEVHPAITPLRERTKEVVVYVPADRLAEDITLIDSPGIHSLLETGGRMMSEIIPDSHLLVCLLDSQNAGCEQNRQFVARLAELRSARLAEHRASKMLFVINKADQLNPGEIDVRGRRGPAKDLLRCLGGVVENPEVFFVSSLYALLSGQLSRNEITLEDLDNNNKVKIPYAVQQELRTDPDAINSVARYLMSRSNLAAFEDRVIDYLYNENRDGAVLEETCAFLDQKAWAYGRPIQARLDMARDVPRLVKLERRSAKLSLELDEIRRRAHAALAEFDAMSGGGAYDGTEYDGYEARAGKMLNAAAVEQNVVQPLCQWIADPANLKQAKRGAFAPLVKQIEGALDAFLDDLHAELKDAVKCAETRAREQAGAIPIEGAKDLPGFKDISRGSVAPIRGGMAGSYFAFGAIGGLLCAAAGAAGGWALVTQGGYDVSAYAPATMSAQAFGAAAAGAAGFGAGLIVGLLARAVTSAKALRARLCANLSEQVAEILLRRAPDAAGGQVVPVLEQLRATLADRTEAFARAAKAAFDEVTTALEDELDTIGEEADALAKERDELVAQLEAKVEKLSALGAQARAIAEAKSPQ